jgi:very-short-patch-repair endonuclease
MASAQAPAGGWLRWRRQFGVGPYVLDFYCPEARLAIELDGAVHHDPERRYADLKRTRALATEGIAVLRFENRELFERIDAVIEAIAQGATDRLRSSDDPLPLDDALPRSTGR